jgi:hypothetical protein
MFRAIQLAAAIGFFAVAATTPASAHSTKPKVMPTPPAQQVLKPGEMSADMKAALLKQGWPNITK